MTCPEWTLSDDNENSTISGLPEFECDVRVNSYTRVALVVSKKPQIESPSDLTTVARRSRSKEEWRGSGKREVYWKIKAKVENAVMVTFLKLVDRVAGRFSSSCVFLENYILRNYILISS